MSEIIRYNEEILELKRRITSLETLRSEHNERIDELERFKGNVEDWFEMHVRETSKEIAKLKSVLKEYHYWIGLIWEFLFIKNIVQKYTFDQGVEKLERLSTRLGGGKEQYGVKRPRCNNIPKERSEGDVGVNPTADSKPAEPVFKEDMVDKAYQAGIKQTTEKLIREFLEDFQELYLADEGGNEDQETDVYNKKKKKYEARLK